ncbi:MAG: PEP-CTERM sorting domain-containing protein [Verrucomicrobiales bacterium]|nr:PEP-CTERM sorting domain-containing protein [Verrucomicrobiales bacterium]
MSKSSRTRRFLAGAPLTVGADTALDLVGGDYILSCNQRPEPGTWALLLTGAGRLAALRRRR